MKAVTLRRPTRLPRFDAEAIMSACQYKSRLDAFHDGQLDPEQSREVSHHVAGCAQCAQDLANLRTLSEALSQVRFGDISQIELARLHKKLDSGTDRSLLRLAGGLTAVAASILIISLAWLTQGSSIRPGDPSPTQVTQTSLPQWEQMAMGADPEQFPVGGIEAPGALTPNTGVAEIPDRETANWMLQSVTR